jgi:hypothetical protein
MTVEGVSASHGRGIPLTVPAHLHTTTHLPSPLSIEELGATATATTRATATGAALLNAIVFENVASKPANFETVTSQSIIFILGNWNRLCDVIKSFFRLARNPSPPVCVTQASMFSRKPTLGELPVKRDKAAARVAAESAARLKPGVKVRASVCTM